MMAQVYRKCQLVQEDLFFIFFFIGHEMWAA